MPMKFSIKNYAEIARSLYSLIVASFPSKTSNYFYDFRPLISHELVPHARHTFRFIVRSPYKFTKQSMETLLWRKLDLRLSFVLHSINKSLIELLILRSLLTSLKFSPI